MSSLDNEAYYDEENMDPPEVVAIEGVDQPKAASIWQKLEEDQSRPYNQLFVSEKNQFLCCQEDEGVCEDFPKSHYAIGIYDLGVDTLKNDPNVEILLARKGGYYEVAQRCDTNLAPLTKQEVNSRFDELARSERKKIK